MWDLPGPGIKPTSPVLAGRFFTTEPPRKPKHSYFKDLWICSVPLTSLSSVGKESACNVGRPWLDSWVGKIPWRRKWQPIPVLLPGEFPGQRSLASDCFISEYLQVSFLLVFNFLSCVVSFICPDFSSKTWLFASSLPKNMNGLLPEGTYTFPSQIPTIFSHYTYGSFWFGLLLQSACDSLLLSTSLQVYSRRPQNWKGTLELK